MKKLLTGALGLLALVLAGCSNSLTTSKTTYHPTALTAVVKGTAKGDQVTYQVKGHAKQTAPIKAGSYFFQVPAATSDQDVKVSSGSAHKTITVKGTQALGTYHKLATQYNQLVIASHLPTKVQKQLQTAKKNQAKTKRQLEKLAQSNPTAAAAAAKKQQAAAKKLKQQTAKEKQAAKDELLPTTAKDGIHNLVKTNGVTLRANVQQGKLMGIAQITSTKKVKTKVGQRQFGTTFALLGTTLKAHPKTVMKKFKQVLKDAKANSSSTKTKTIRSNGIRFNTGFSTDNLYIYMTK
ncbi:hypothetical protein [Levilactobacillus suantsaii]|uniref:Lipoprotein n=1 Tax=Levilactobacillus suantsaii TaxID=2292255 RepID=A0A4Q0VKZ3_9LACO|nr:hypothetical protein [Levilactobacillus suantsaii]QMU08186.1 hypothetical protein H3M12_00430 [Levilactobacillus suantsaii]RXI79096.1 hypothetical protein DXH47_04795 [Levilactobacillus suantsaii]